MRRRSTYERSEVETYRLLVTVLISVILVFFALGAIYTIGLVTP